jgi:hypothetical protein
MMTADTKKNPPPVSPGPGNPKSTLVAIAKAALGKRSKLEPPAPARAAIEAQAFEIWMARGQEHGHDQEHWYEAERQLRQQD